MSGSAIYIAETWIAGLRPLHLVEVLHSARCDDEAFSGEQRALEARRPISAEPTAGGLRYAAPEVDFREHPGEATVVWSGVRMNCRLRR